MTIYSRELDENPPVDDLVQVYFIANKWWQPPARQPDGGAGDAAPEVWECPFPEVTE